MMFEFDDATEGAAYLSALKKSGTPQAAGTATARAPEAAPPVKTPANEVAPSNRPYPSITDKRKGPRHRCKGSAHLQESGTAATWATFADISLYGCYIETPAPLRVGTTLGLTLEMNGFRVQASGEVRVAYPSLGMGIRFIQLSETNRAQLREMVGSISHSSMNMRSLAAKRAPSMPPSDAFPGLSNPVATLQAILNFFETRHVMGREEFLSILRKSH
jgi:hypothetical protein